MFFNLKDKGIRLLLFLSSHTHIYQDLFFFIDALDVKKVLLNFCAKRSVKLFCFCIWLT
uniref:Uncharacterized protein n=1 Tax=Octopus bimaculoides TaxID=37653 RepID=A0A0L8H300_OCTBM